MGKGVQVVIGLIMVAVLMIVFPIVMSATHDLQTDNQVDVDLAITGTPPAGNVTLTTDLWNANINSVLSIVGNGTEEPGAITATGYTEATRVLALTGISDSTTATVTYEVDALTDFTGMGSLVGITPLLIWIAILAVVIGGLWFTFRRGA